MFIFMDGINSNSVANKVSKPSNLMYQSEQAHKDLKKQQHQQFVLGLDKQSILHQKVTGK